LNKLEIRGAIMAVLFVAGEAVDVSVFRNMLGIMPDTLEIVIQEMIEDMRSREEGVLVKRVGNKLQLATNEKYSSYIKEVFAPEIKTSLSNSVIETLAVIAYKQPVTRSEIDEVRGVHSGYAVQALREKGLVHVIGKKDVLGRPSLLATTDEFLRHFGLESLEQLPPIDFDNLDEAVHALEQDEQTELALEEMEV
jgi:segregation and condensation protein B